MQMALTNSNGSERAVPVRAAATGKMARRACALALDVQRTEIFHR